MKLLYKEPSARISDTGLLVLLACQGEQPELPKGVVLPAFAAGEFKGEFREARQFDALSGPAQRVLVLGLGKESDVDNEKLRRAAAVAVQRAEAVGVPSATLFIDRATQALVGGDRAGTAIAEGAVMGAYRFEQGKSKPKEEKLKTLIVTGPGAGLRAGVNKGVILAEANCFVRDLQNKPANLMTPRDMAAAAKKLEKGRRITCSILTERAMESLGMGLLLGVAQGSREAPRLIHLVYKPAGKPRGKIALVGKGLTFDSGGISIKPSAKMDEMRFDMSGGGAVLGVFHALAKLDVPWEVHGVVPCTENMPGGKATKPGDIHRAMNGMTVEVLNTDAEGRLVLADAISYVVEKVKPQTIIDLATLTGAVVTALGHELSGMFASTDRLRDKLMAAGEETGERLWPLPLLDAHRDGMKGMYADLKNISGGDMGAGSSAGAAFLAPFVGDVEWAHLDIAGTAWGGANRDWVGGPMGSGVGTRMLVRYLETRK
jgi:leucyl aminopeptidase